MQIKHIKHTKKVDSTSEVLKHKAHGFESGTLLWAYEQTAGRGTRGKTWVASPGENLTFSFLIHHRKKQQATIQSAIALAIKDVLADECIDALFKLPNDIFVKNQKIGGILVETKTVDEKQHTIIGVGINVNQLFKGESFEAISMRMIHHQAFDLHTLLKRCVTYYNEYVSHSPFSKFKAWALKNPIQAYYQGDHVTIVDFDVEFRYKIRINGRVEHVDGAHLTFQIPAYK